METTKTYVRSNMKYARRMMQLANETLKVKNPTAEQLLDWEQIAMELTASASTFQQYIDEQLIKQARETK